MSHACGKNEKSQFKIVKVNNPKFKKKMFYGNPLSKQPEFYKDTTKCMRKCNNGYTFLTKTKRERDAAIGSNRRAS